MCCSFDLMTRYYESAAFFCEKGFNVSTLENIDFSDDSSSKEKEPIYKHGLLQSFIKKEYMNEITFPCTAFGQTTDLAKYAYPTAFETAVSYQPSSEQAKELSKMLYSLQSRVWVTSHQFTQKGIIIPYFYCQQFNGFFEV